MLDMMLVLNLGARRVGYVEQFSNTLQISVCFRSRFCQDTVRQLLAHTTRAPIVPFAETVQTVCYTDITDETVYAVLCDQPEDLAGCMPSGPPKVGTRTFVPRDQVRRTLAALNNHPAQKDPGQPGERYNCKQVFDKFLSAEDYFSGYMTPFGVDLLHRFF